MQWELSRRPSAALPTRQPAQRPEARTAPKQTAIGVYLRVTAEDGLTLRMAGEIVQALQPLDVDVAFVHRGVVANARSILSIVSLAAAHADRVYVWARGEDAELAVEILAQAFAGGQGLTPTEP
jgi:phosphotransferase system HPr (HPr) family protein